MKKYTRQTFLILSTAALIVSCKEDEKPEFDRKAMLTNMASAVIIPAYTTLNSSLGTLYTKATDFTASPNTITLADLRAQYIQTNKNYQRCAMYNFGPAMDYGIKIAFNTFPSDTAKIEANITAGTYTLGAVSNTTAIGFPALDYLLYFGTDTDILTKFTTDPEAANRKTYLTDLVSKMKTEFQPVIDQWNGSYQTTFINADGNDVASSCSYLLNEFVQDIELVKNAKIGIPSGQQTGGATMPTYVEAYYSGLSTTFAYESLLGLETCFTGGSGSGFDDYIRDVESDDVTTSLADNILTQFGVCKTKTDALADPLSTTVNADFASVNDLYLELKKLLVYCKTDMTSMLGILITYQDNDGD
ncbi:MAG: imelysin family protein [Bacteroidetes bacterium]|nr:imelysin family protein [Bacteroidota bacterium]